MLNKEHVDFLAGRDFNYVIHCASPKPPDTKLLPEEYKKAGDKYVDDSVKMMQNLIDSVNKANEVKPN